MHHYTSNTSILPKRTNYVSKWYGFLIGSYDRYPIQFHPGKRCQENRLLVDWRDLGEGEEGKVPHGIGPGLS